MKRRYWTGGKRTYEQDRFFEKALDTAVWQRGDVDDWHACWYTGMPKPSMFSRVGPDRKINHIPGNNALTVKSRLSQSLVTLRQRVSVQQGDNSELKSRLQFLPRVFSMPEDYHDFQQVAMENPAKRWILKPKNAARGKGIRLLADAASAPMGSSWMVQEYVENPHLMRGRKYVLRLYVLVSSINPLRVYLYRQGFAKLASAPYDQENIDNPYSYLTNPDINALNLEAEVPVEFVEFADYRQWLKEQGHDDGALFGRIEDMVTLTCISAVEAMRERTAAVGADPRGCYELLGIDCLVDEQLNPWILECNLSPSLEVCAAPESGGDIEEKVKSALVADMVHLVGLSELPSQWADVRTERQLVQEAEQELARSGGFQRLYPSARADQYLPFFTLPRLQDWVLAKALCPSLPEPRLRRRYAQDSITDDQVHVYETHTGRLNALNETGSLIWLMATDGAGPEQIAQALTAAAEKAAPASVDTWAIRNDVWNCLADWVNRDLLIQADPAGTQHAESEPFREDPKNSEFTLVLNCGVLQVEFLTDSLPVVRRLEAALKPMAVKAVRGAGSRLEVVRDTPGYTLVFDGKVVWSRLQSASVAPAVMACLARHAAGSEDTVLDASLVASAQSENSGLLIAGGDNQLYDAFAVHFAHTRKVGFARAVRLSGAGRVSSLGLPGHIPQSLLSDFEQSVTPQWHLLPSGGEAALVPAFGNLVGKQYPVAAVVIPTRSDLADTGGIQALTLSQALVHLIPASCARGGRPLDAAGFLRLAEWLEDRDLLLLDVRDPKVATTRLLSAIATADKDKGGQSVVSN